LIQKDAVSLVEVLISVMLISVVIVSLLQIKDNNLYFLDKSKKITKYNAYISMVALDNNKDGNIYLNNYIDFRDDELRREFKKIKIKVRNDDLKSLKIGTNEYMIYINIQQTKLNIEDKIERNFYKFTLNNSR
jgi:hypothetical protein